MINFFSRLDNYLQYKGLNDNKLTIETGISNGLIGKARKRGALSQENISKILYKYTELDANWLLTGEGSMLKSGVQKEAPPPPEAHNTGALDQLRKENAMQALLIESQTKTIAGLEFQVATLEKELLLLKPAPKTPILYRSVAEPARELIAEKHK